MHDTYEILMLARNIVEDGCEDGGESAVYEAAQCVVYQHEDGNVTYNPDTMFNILSGVPAETGRRRRQRRSKGRVVENAFQVVNVPMATVEPEDLLGMPYMLERMINEPAVTWTEQSVIDEINDCSEVRLHEIMLEALRRLRIYSGHVQFLSGISQSYVDRGQFFGNQAPAIRKVLIRYRKQFVTTRNERLN